MLVALVSIGVAVLVQALTMQLDIALLRLSAAVNPAVNIADSTATATTPLNSGLG
jgi:hypothetical protein